MIVNVSYFDPGFSNLGDVMNKKYIDNQDKKKVDIAYVYQQLSSKADKNNV